MYREEYEKRGFPIRGFLVKLILGILLILLLIWLVPKFVKPVATSNKNGCSGEICEQLSEKLKGLDALTATIFANNIDKMKNAAISYYTNERLPKNIGDSTKMSLREMISKHLLTPLVDKSGKAVDVDKSYVEITKYSDEYILKVNIKDSSNEDYILVHLGFQMLNSRFKERLTTHGLITSLEDVRLALQQMQVVSLHSLVYLLVIIV